MCSTLIYIWAKKNPKMAISLFGLFNFRAPYLPYMFLLTNMFLRGTLSNEVFGIMVGHTYFYLYFVVPKLPMTMNVNLLAAPEFFKSLTDLLGLDSKRQLLLEEGDFVDDEDFEQRLNNNPALV